MSKEQFYGALLSHFDQHNRLVWNTITFVFTAQGAVLAAWWSLHRDHPTVAFLVSLMGLLITLSLWLYVRKAMNDRDIATNHINRLARELQELYLSGVPDPKLEVEANLGPITLTCKTRPKAREVLLANLLLFGLVDLVLMMLCADPLVYSFLPLGVGFGAGVVVGALLTYCLCPRIKEAAGAASTSPDTASSVDPPAES